MRPENIETMINTLVKQAVHEEVTRAVKEATRPDEFLSTRTAAKIADVSLGTIRRWVDTGKLTEHRAGSRIRVSRNELERLLKSWGASNDELSPEQLAAKRFG